jgi:3-hydroxyisobutyrate dehydrogenase-like beta-hydroxyacid dehydrogenase
MAGMDKETVSMSETVGVVGTGLVGTAIAELLLEAGFGVVVWNRTRSKTQGLVAQGARAADTPAEVGTACRRVFVSVMTTATVAELVEGPGGLLAGDAKTEYILDTTTGDPEETMVLAARLAERGVRFLDATISGSSKQIRDRVGLYMVGGGREAFDACEDLFRAVTQKYVHVGPSGSGSKAKLASNVVLGLNRLALAEGLVFAEKLGLAAEPFLELLKMSAAYSVAMDVKGAKMIHGDFEPQARLRQHLKDIRIVLKYAESLGQDMPLSELHCAIMEAGVAAGDGELDNSAVIRELRRRAVQPASLA